MTFIATIVTVISLLTAGARMEEQEPIGFLIWTIVGSIGILVLTIPVLIVI